MNPILLSEWLSVCSRAGVEAIPATAGPAVRIDEIRGFVTGGRPAPTLRAAWEWLRVHYQPGTTMWRWDCCSPEGLKDAMHEGATDAAPELELEPDDPRLGLVLDELERFDVDSVHVLVRPWIRARVEAGVPVELRAFAMPGGAAVSNYHRRRPLPTAYEPVARLALALTERLAGEASISAFSGDFLLAESGALLFLEGGLGYDGGRLVNVCCFDRPPQPGEIALQPTRRRNESA